MMRTAIMNTVLNAIGVTAMFILERGNKMEQKELFSLKVFQDGTVEVIAEDQTYKLKPRNLAVLLAPIMATFATMIGSDIVLRQRLKTLTENLPPQISCHGLQPGPFQGVIIKEE
jgi:hypothetical protein